MGASVAYNEVLAGRVRDVLAGRKDVTEMKMFGGLAFMVRGNMFCGVVRDNLMVRVGPEHHEAALAQPYARPMDFTGRPLKGMIYVLPEGYRTDEALKSWVEDGLKFALLLPPK